MKWLSKLFSKKASDNKEPVEEQPEDEAMDIWQALSTHTPLTAQARQEILANPFQVTPDKFKMVGGGAMDSSQQQSAKQAFTLGQQRINQNLFSWYVMQSFIGYQACGLIAQHWLIERACSLKGRDAARKGYDILCDSVDLTAKQIKFIEKQDRKFKIKKQLEEADKFKNVNGIRHVLFVVDSTDPDYYEKPFNPDGITPGSYKGISQIDPYWVTQNLTTEGVTEPVSQYFYEPEFWVISGKKYHRSHFVIMRGPEVADILKPSYQYGGLPLTQRIMERVYAAERTANEAPQLAMTKRLNVRKMDLEKAMGNLSNFETSLNQFANFRDNYGIEAIGKDEEHQQLETTLTDLDVTIMTQYQIVAGQSGIPATKLMGTSPKGFNATGEHEIETYHEELESIQENDLSPIVERHHICLMRSIIAPKFKVEPFEIEHEWRPLAVMSEVDQSTVSVNKANSDKLYSDMGAVDAYDIRDKLIADKDSGYTGLEAVERPEEEEIDLTPPEEEQPQEEPVEDSIGMDEIRHENNKWWVYSEEGKRLSRGYQTKGEAENRLQEIEYWKTREHKG